MYQSLLKKMLFIRYSKPDKGELYQPFEIIPEASAKISEKVIIFENDKQRDITVIVKAGRDNLEGYVEVCHPKDWNIFPEKQKVSITNKGEEQTLIFTLFLQKIKVKDI